MVDTQTSDGKKERITDTDTTKENSPHKLLTNREITAIIQYVIPPINQKTANGVATSGRDLHAVRAVLHKKIVTGATYNTAGVLKYPPVVNWKDMSRRIPVDINTAKIPPIITTQVWTGTGSSAPLISIGIQNIDGPRRSIITQKVRNTDPLNTSINRITAKHRDLTPSWSKVIGSKTSTNKSANVYGRGRMNFASDTVLSESPNFMDFGLSSVKKPMNSGPSLYPLPQLEARRVDPTGSHLAGILVKLQRIE